MLNLTKILSKGSSLFFATICTLVILYLSLVNDFPDSGQIKINDKLGHLTAYLFLAFFWMMYTTYLNNKTKYLFYVAILCLIYGIIIEMMQGALTATRTPSFLDVCANTLGITIAFVIVNRLKKTIKK